MLTRTSIIIPREDFFFFNFALLFGLRWLELLTLLSYDGRSSWSETVLPLKMDG